MEKDWVMVYTTDKLYEAELLKEILRDNNINAILLNKQDSAYKSFGDIEIYVNTRNVIRAKLLINEFESGNHE